MSPRRKGKRAAGWKPPRDRREVVIAVLASLAVIVVTASLVWFLRPNRNSGSTSVNLTPTTTIAPGATTTTPTTAPASTSTP
jgi:hypothetical protein